MSANDELVSQFIAFTGCSDPERAQSYLEMSGGNVETAVGLYMEHQPGAGAGSGAAAGGAVDEVRAPDETQTMQLMDDHSHGAYHPVLMDPLLQQRLVSSAFSEPSSLFGSVRDAVNAAAAMADDEDEDDDENMPPRAASSRADSDDDDDGDGVNSTSTPATARLADMFAAPTHLIYSEGGFEGARNMAKDNKRWLLVNLQRDSEFSCHALNRDVWRDELVENLVREGFIFWQAMDIAPEGQVYAQRYHVHDFPHIAIIDPRTRRLLWRKEGWTQQNPLTASSFAEIAMDFCSRHSFDKPPAAPRPGSAAARPVKRSVDQMSEEEQLRAAMLASMNDGESGGGDSDDMEDEYQYNNDDEEDGGDNDSESANDAANSKPSATSESKPVSLIDELLNTDVPDEPSSGARIQLRMPDGKRVVRKFDSSATVRSIYVFFVHLNDEAKGGKEFVMLAGYPPKDLIDDIDATIEESKLSGQAITIRWK